MADRSVTYFAGGCVIVVAVIMLLLGLIFMIGSQGKGSTLLTGIVMLVLGLGAGIFTIRKLAGAVGSSPDAIDERILNLATMSGGEITVGEVTGALQVSIEDAQASLERLVSEGMAEYKTRGDDLYYIFAGIATVRKVKRCAYCGTEFPLREPGQKCSSCGGNLEIIDATDS